MNSTHSSSAASAKPTAVRWTINPRVLISTVLLLVVAVPAAWGWHRLQVSRNATALLERAATQEREEDWNGAAENLHRYLLLQPDDAAARARLAATYDKTADNYQRKTRAAQLYALAIGLHDGPPKESLEMRRRLMTLLLETGDYAGSLARSEDLLKSDAEDAAAARVKALSLLAQWRFQGSGAVPEVVKALQAANQLQPGEVLIASELARLLRREVKSPAPASENALADAVMKALIDASPESAEAHLARYLYREEFTLPDADADLRAAIALDADVQSLGVRLAAGSNALGQEDFEAAAAFARQAIEIEPKDRRGYLLLGQATRGLGDEEAAVTAWSEGLKSTSPRDITLLSELAGSRISLKRLAEAKQALDVLDKQIAVLVGPERIRWLSVLYGLRGELYLAQNDYPAATAEFRRVLDLQEAGAQSNERVAATVQTILRIGQSQMALQRPEQAAVTFERAIQRQPRNANARLGAATAWAAAGRLDRAIVHYEVLHALEDASFESKLQFASALLRQQMVSGAAQRNWEPLEKVLSGLKTLQPESLALRWLEAEAKLAQGESAAALAIMQAAEQEALEDPQQAGRLASLYERSGKPADADRILAALPVGSVDQLALQAQLLLSRGERDKAQQRLKEALQHADLAKQPAMRGRVAAALVSAGDAETARAIFDELAAQESGLQFVQLAADLAMQAKDYAAVEKWESRLKSIEGANGTLWRLYRAQRLLSAADNSDKEKHAEMLREASRLQAEVVKLRPDWPAAYVLKARVQLAQRNPDVSGAINAYTQAVQLGENRASVYQALISLLYRQNRLAEAETYLNRLRDAEQLPSEIASLAIAVDVGQGKLDQALNAARQAVEREPENFVPHMQLGQLLALSLPQDEPADSAATAAAEGSLLRARELAPENVAPYFALVSFYSSRQPEEAKKLLTEMEAGNWLKSEDKAFVLAQGYALLKDNDRAKEFYTQALESLPDRLDVHLQAAGFFFQLDPPQAEKCLRRALELDRRDSRARHLLAVLLITRSGSDQNMSEVAQLVSEMEAQGFTEPGDQRIKALMLLRRGGASGRQQAQRVLESLVKSPQASAFDRLMLARLYDAQGNAESAGELLAEQVDDANAQPGPLAAYIDHLLKHGRATEAATERHLEQLSSLEPESAFARTLSLRAAWLKAQGKEDKLPPLVEEFLTTNLAKRTNPAEQAQLQLFAASIYGSAELHEAAEEAYQKALKLDAASFAPYAEFLARRSRLAEGLRLCMQSGSRPELLPRAAMTASTLLTVVQSSEQDRRIAEPLLELAVKQLPKHTGVLFCVATFRLMQGENEQAIELLRRVLEIEPRNLQALNNLAMLLAEQPQGRQEAIQYLNQAIEIAGLNPELLDSKGWVLLLDNQPAEAEGLFRDAVSLPPGDPRHLLHLAMALHAQNKSGAAQEALDRAYAAKLDQAPLTPDERVRLDQLATALRDSSPSASAKE